MKNYWSFLDFTRRVEFLSPDIFYWAYLVVCNYKPTCIAPFHSDIELNVYISPDHPSQQFFSHVGTFPGFNQY